MPLALHFFPSLSNLTDRKKKDDRRGSVADSPFPIILLHPFPFYPSLRKRIGAPEQKALTTRIGFPELKTSTKRIGITGQKALTKRRGGHQRRP